MINMVITRYTGLLIFAPIALIIVLVLTITGDRAYYNGSYNYKILDIQYEANQHGSPRIQVDTGYFLIAGHDLKIISYIQKGDSVVKRAKSKEVEIYRYVNGKLTVKKIK